jgi:hypothetical protein
VRCVLKGLKGLKGQYELADVGAARNCWSRFDSERHATVLPTGGDAKFRDSGEIAKRIGTEFMS